MTQVGHGALLGHVAEASLCRAERRIVILNEPFGTPPYPFITTQGGNMSTAKIYTINYQLHGQPKSFVVRAEVMNNAEAWHWAAVDADIAHVSRVGRVGHEQVKKTTRPWAEKFGITEVTWIAPK
jgi:hypothetical protein